MRRSHFARHVATVVASLTLIAAPLSGSAETDGQKITGFRGGGGNGGGNGGGAISSATLAAEAGVRSMKLTWSNNGASQYNVYVSSSRNCDISNYSLCPDGQMFIDVRSPFKIDGLENGRVYYAKVEGVHKKGLSLSNEAGARPTTLEFNDSVWAIAKADDGTTYVGGDFTRIGLTSGHAVVLDAVSAKSSVPAFPIFSGGTVSAATPDGAGGWYIGGGFRRVAESNKAFFVHVRADGSVDRNWNPQPNGPVYSIAVMDGVVYVGGAFTSINGQQRSGVAAVDAASGILLPWNPNPNLGVWTIVAVNGKIYIGGTFTWVGAFRRSYLAAIDTSGNVLPWDPSPDGTVATLALAGSTIYAGGFFNNVSDQPRVKIAAIDAVTGVPKAWDASLGCLGCEVRAIAVLGGTVYVGGRFPEIGGVARSSLAAVDATTGSVRAWNPGVNDSVRSLAAVNDPSRGATIYAAGDFTTIGDKPRSFLAALDATGNVLSWDPAPTTTVEVVSVAGNQVLAGGRFTGLGATVRNRLAAIEASGALTPWDPGANGSVRAIVVADDMIYAGGGFTSAGGQARGRLARFDPTGSVDGWNPGMDRPVLALALGAAGNLYAGGEFRHVAGTPRNYLAAFNASGTLLGWAPNADYEVHSLAAGPYLVTGESVYVGGKFGAINGQVRRRIAQVDAWGQPTAWNPWGYNLVEHHETVHALVYANGIVYAGGIFAQLGQNFAQISETGTILRLATTNSRVWSLSLSGHTLSLGGDFSSVWVPGTYTPRNRLAAIDTTSHTLTAWSPDIGNGSVYAMTSDSEVVHVGGSFTVVEGQVGSGFATLTP